jgi:cytochrome bd-type quinol oxidase subunit 2
MIKSKRNAAIYAVTIMMLSTGIIYFVAASETESTDLSGSVEMTLFVVSGCAYIAVGLWMVKSKEGKGIPYLVAIVGSLALIALYILSRTISLPIVGLQGDVGTIDVLSKVLQIGIVAGSMYLLKQNKRHELINNELR